MFMQQNNINLRNFVNILAEQANYGISLTMHLPTNFKQLENIKELTQVLVEKWNSKLTYVF